MDSCNLDFIFCCLDKVFKMISVEPMQPRWLKLKDACLYSGIGKKRIKKLADAGDIRGFKDPDDERGTWLFDRKSIDSYRLNQADAPTIAALEVLQRL